MFKCYVKPILEYDGIIFSSHCIYLIDLIEHIQRNFTKRLRGLKNKSYNDRQKTCGLKSLECRMLHNDLIFLYKILNGLELVHFYNELDMCRNVRPNVCIRGNVYKLEK